MIILQNLLKQGCCSFTIFCLTLYFSNNKMYDIHVKFCGLVNPIIYYTSETKTLYHIIYLTFF